MTIGNRKSDKVNSSGLSPPAHQRSPPHTMESVAKPFLKWAGSKTQLVRVLRAMLPDGNRLIEPFVGSGVVFLNTRYSQNLLSDSNRDLIQLYSILKAEPQSF